MGKDNDITFNFHFNAPVGQNIAHADKVEVHFDKDMGMQIVDTAALVNENVSEETIQTVIPESVKECFRFANGFVEECVKNIVKDFYSGRNIDMAMIEVVLFDHGLLKKRNNHKAFVRALLDWGILPADTDIVKLSNGMATKLKSPFPEEGYKSWDNCYLNDRTLCIAIGEKLPDSIRYMR